MKWMRHEQKYFIKIKIENVRSQVGGGEGNNISLKKMKYVIVDGM